jgi:hypothetical protein
MSYPRNVCAVAIAAVASAALSPSAVAEENNPCPCQAIGGGAPESLGDREGHSISVSQVSCRIDSGPLSGGVLTGSSIWEWDGPDAVELIGSGVIRKPGATAAYQESGGKLALTMADGKVTGWTATGRFTFVMATGSAASMASKSFIFSASQATCPAGQFASGLKPE